MGWFTEVIILRWVWVSSSKVYTSSQREAEVGYETAPHCRKKAQDTDQVGAFGRGGLQYFPWGCTHTCMQIQEWSEDNEELYRNILENGMAEHICNKEYLFEFYRHLSFDHQGLSTIDETCLRFRNLAVLSLSQNNIKVNHPLSRPFRIFLQIAKNSIWISTKYRLLS